MRLKILIKTFILTLLLLQIISNTPDTQKQPVQLFPQLLWTFWDGDLTKPNSEIFLKLCLNNMKNYASRSGWQFNLVTYKNLPQFLSRDNYDRCMRLLSFINVNFKQMRADIIRLFLLKQNGGMWVDASTFFVEDLGWVNNITNSKLPFNKISSQPDFISFRLTQYDKPESHIWDQNLKNYVLVSPGIQNWAMIAKRNISFIRDSLQIIQKIITEGDKAVNQKAIGSGVVLSQSANNSYFRFGIYTFQLVLQFKQQELDQYHAKARLNNKKMHHQSQILPKYAVEHYKIWTIDGHDMGFNLENITDGLAPFLTVLFLYSDYRIINQLKIQLKGFIKLGGVKRKYIQIMLQNMISPEMCLITAEDTFALSNQSYIYKHMIEGYNEPSGLVLKDHITNIEDYQRVQEKTCEVTPKDQKLKHVEQQIDQILFYLCILISFMALVCFLWIKFHNLSRFEAKNLLYFTIAALIAILIIFSPKSYRLQENNRNFAGNNTCSTMKFQQQFQAQQKSQVYLQQLRSQLPNDKGQLFTMFFQQKIQGLKGGFSEFLSNNQGQFQLYFSKYFIGLALCLFFMIRNRISILCRIANYVNCRTNIRKVLVIIGICILFLTFSLSLLAFKKAVALNESTEKSLCYFVQMPRLFSNQTQIFKKDQPNGLNYLQFFNTLNTYFHKLYMTIIVYQGSFLKQSPQYFNQLQETKKLLNSSSSSDQQLLTLIESKSALLKRTQESSNGTYKTLICQHNFNHLVNFVLTNLKNLRTKLQYFLNNFIKLQSFSFALSTLPIAISLIFCTLSGILFINNLKKWRQKRNQMYFKKYRPTIMVLSILGLLVSLALDSIVLVNYYFCNNLLAYKHSLQDNPQQLLNVIPDKCISTLITDIFQKNLNQNFQLRQQPFRNFVGLSDNMEQISNFPFAEEQRLLSTLSSNSATLAKFKQSNQNYNTMLQKYSQAYFKSKMLIEKELQVKYHIPGDIHALRDTQKIFYQPLCVFNFNILYQLAFLFRYFAFLNLMIFFITILLQPKNIIIICKNEQICINDEIKNEKCTFSKINEQNSKIFQVAIQNSSSCDIQKSEIMNKPQMAGNQ